MPFTVHADGVDRPAQVFSDPRMIEFHSPFGPRSAYLFPFSDQVFFPETLGARTAISRLALEPPWLGALLSALIRLRVTRMLRRRAGAEERVQRLSARLQRRYRGCDWYGITVEIQGARGWIRVGLAGREQATGTAIGAAAVVRALDEGEVNQPGIWLVEQVVPPRPFFERLAAYGLVPTVEARFDDSRSVPGL